LKLATRYTEQPNPIHITLRSLRKYVFCVIAICTIVIIIVIIIIIIIITLTTTTNKEKDQLKKLLRHLKIRRRL